MQHTTWIYRLAISVACILPAASALGVSYCDQSAQTIPQPAGWLYSTAGQQRVLDDFHGFVGGPKVIHFWGIAVDRLGQVNPTAFLVRFYGDDAGAIGPLVAEEIVPATVAASYPWASYLKLRRYQVELPAPVPLSDGWIEIRAAEDGDADFYWLTAPAGNDFAYIIGGGANGYVGLDMAVCFETRCEPQEVIVVDSLEDAKELADSYAGDGCVQTFEGKTTLRSALMEGGASGIRPLIDLTALPLGAIIKLYAPLEIRGPVDVMGPGADALTISGQGKSGVLLVDSDCTIGGLSFMHGKSTNVRAVEIKHGDVLFEDCAFEWNRGRGAVRQYGGTATFARCSFERNEGEDGAALIMDHWDRSQTITLEDCSFVDNTASVGGGAVRAKYGIVRAVNSNFYRNKAHLGAALWGAKIDVFNCTLSGNRSNLGAVYTASDNGSFFRMTNCTVVRNSTPMQSGAVDDPPVGGLELAYGTSDLRIYNSIIAGNYASRSWLGVGPDIHGQVADAAFNFVGDLTGSSGFIGRNNINAADLGISDLRTVFNPHPNLNGGATLTHALVNGSPALNSGYDHYLNVAALAPWKDWDQRGTPYKRINGAGLDLGAYEYQPPLVTTPDPYETSPAVCLEICEEQCPPEVRQYDLDFFAPSVMAAITFVIATGEVHDYIAVGLLERILEDPTHPLCCCARSAFDANSAALEDALAHSAPAFLSSDYVLLLRDYQDRIVAALTAGGPALVQSVQNLLEDMGTTIDLSTLDRRMAGVLGVYGDVDGDGACNGSETLAHIRRNPDYTTAPYVDDSLNPLQSEGLGICESCGGHWPSGGPDISAELLDYFSFLDTSGNAELTWAEATFWGISRDLFSNLDIDGNGALVRKELLLATTHIGTHAADQDENFSINLNELLRVIQFFNTGGITCYSAGEDGYRPVANPSSLFYSQPCLRHSADTDFNWRINLSELLRVVQIFNIGAYDYCPFADTEDGFCPRN
jgi:hypothetical protein